MDWLSRALTFASGTLIGVIGSRAAVAFNRQSEQTKNLAERRHLIYMLLLDLYHQHFWISTNDMHRTEIRRELKEEFQKAKYEIMDELRTADGLQQLPDIVDVLASLRFRTETDRAVRLRKVIDDLGKGVNPRFLAAAMKADQQNMRLMMSNSDAYWERRSKVCRRLLRQSVA